MYSGVFTHMIATLSSGSRPAPRSTCARRSARSSNCANVRCRSLQTSATRSGASAATVSQARANEWSVTLRRLGGAPVGPVLPAASRHGPAAGQGRDPDVRRGIEARFGTHGDALVLVAFIAVERVEGDRRPGRVEGNDD